MPARATSQPSPQTLPPRERILAATRTLFAEKGFDGLTLRSVAAKAGLHNSSLFHHFDGKAAIVEQAFLSVIDGVAQRLVPLAQDDPPRLDTFVRVLGNVSDAFLAEPDEARFLLRVIIGPSGFASYVEEVDRADPSHPLVRLFSGLWGWMKRAKAHGVIRPLNVNQATRNLIGILLFEPAFPRGHSHYSQLPLVEQQRVRREELIQFVRGGFTPETRL